MWTYDNIYIKCNNTLYLLKHLVSVWVGEYEVSALRASCQRRQCWNCLCLPAEGMFWIGRCSVQQQTLCLLLYFVCLLKHLGTNTAQLLHQLWPNHCTLLMHLCVGSQKACCLLRVVSFTAKLKQSCRCFKIRDIGFRVCNLANNCDLVTQIQIQAWAQQEWLVQHARWAIGPPKQTAK